MSHGPSLRQPFQLVLARIETTEGVDANPTAVDAVPVEADSISYNVPVRAEDSNEATGSLVAGAPRIVGQPVTLRFRSQVKGAAATYTSTVRPPHHALLSACGFKGVFQAAIASGALGAVVDANNCTCPTGFPGVAQALRGMPLVLTGTAAGRIPFVTSYTAARVATLTDSFTPPLDNTSSASVPALWTYAPTSPRTLADRATDHPSVTIYIYQDGILLRFLGVRGSFDITGTSASGAFFEFTFTGVFAGRSDAALPAATAALHTGPALLQGALPLPAFAVTRQQLPIEQFALRSNTTVESPADPNSAAGFDPAVIGVRRPTLECNPLMSTVAARDVIGDIQAGTQYPAVVRMGTVAGNRFAITLPLVQNISSEPGNRGILLSEQLQFRAVSGGVDNANRDGDVILCFY